MSHEIRHTQIVMWVDPLNSSISSSCLLRRVTKVVLLPTANSISIVLLILYYCCRRSKRAILKFIFDTSISLLRMTYRHVRRQVVAPPAQSCASSKKPLSLYLAYLTDYCSCAGGNRRIFYHECTIYKTGDIGIRCVQPL